MHVQKFSLLCKRTVFLLGFVHLIFCVDAWESFGVSSGHRLLICEGMWKAALGVFALDVWPGGGLQSWIHWLSHLAPSPTLNDSLFFSV